jgi:hypothetical protein
MIIAPEAEMSVGCGDGGSDGDNDIVYWESHQVPDIL